MSFILDALKKSESDRQRHSGPALFEVKVAPPRTGLPPWAIAVLVLLAVNLLVVMGLLLRRAPTAVSTNAPATSAAGTNPIAPGVVANAATASASGGTSPAGAAVTSTAIPNTATANTVTANNIATNTAASSAVTGNPSNPARATALGDGVASSMARLEQPAAAAPLLPVPSSDADSSLPAPDPQDYAPATERPGGSPTNSHVRRGTGTGVPLYQEVAGAPGTRLPPLRLDLHVFAPQPRDRFVMINMHRLRPGDSLPEGVRVDDITPEGAVLSFNGSRFLLPRD